MFRISRFVRELTDPTPVAPRRNPPGPVVIWNLIRRCNLTCRHCYSISADTDFKGELSHEEVLKVLQDLHAFKVPALILSGGEPLLRPDILDIARASKALGIHTSLSTNGTLIDETRVNELAAIGFDYVGISLDGLGATHDAFRRKAGAFDASLKALRLCRDAGLKVGVRYTMTGENAHDFRPLLQLVREERIPRFYFSHLNYAGRGNKNRHTDASHQASRQAMTTLFEHVWEDHCAGRELDFTTGNQDADGPWFLHWVQERFPHRAPHIEAKLRQWGGNASGVNVANIDNLGFVHPDTMWWHLPLGNVREQPFSTLWRDSPLPLMAALRQHPRPVGGRCGQCRYLALCNGSSRVRAEQAGGDVWGEDPACYLADEEIQA